jgi:translation initiation factor IF-2
MHGAMLTRGGSRGGRGGRGGGTRQAKYSRRRKQLTLRTEEPPRAATIPHAGLTAHQLSVLAKRPLSDVLSAARELEPSLRPVSDAHLSPAVVELVVDSLRAPVVVTQQVVPLLNERGIRNLSSTAEKAMAQLPLRVPVVTVMGHVDVGKTTLLDALRKSDVALHEKGGITQSIGAFRVSLPTADSKTVTFIDTPGHEAFTSMRAHGAEATDVVVLVVAADDGVMPQTMEAVEHARSAGVPIVVAINKCDKEGADPDRVRYQLLEMANVNTEQLGGDVQCVEVAAKTGLNLGGLVEAILLQAELLDLRADVTEPAQAVCLESRVDRQLGSVATVVVKWGTLRVGDLFVHSSLTALSGDVYGRVRTMTDSNSSSVAEAQPGDAVVVSGFKTSPQPGAELLGMPSERKAKDMSQGIILRNAQASATLDLIEDMERRAAEMASKHSIKYSNSVATTSFAPQDHVSASVTKTEDEGDVSEETAAPEKNTSPVVNVVIKADVQGGADAVAQCVERLSSVDCPIRILHVGVGEVTENDVLLASATRHVKNNTDESLVIAFNVRVANKALSVAKRASVDLLAHNLIYKLEEDIIQRNKDMVESRQSKENTVGAAGCVRVFEEGAIAGCLVQDGAMAVGKLGRVMRFPRDGTVREVVFQSEISSIKQLAKDVRKVSKGSECGIAFAGYSGFLAGDVIECVEIEEAGGSRAKNAGSRIARKRNLS